MLLVLLRRFIRQLFEIRILDLTDVQRFLPRALARRTLHTLSSSPQHVLDDRHENSEKLVEDIDEYQPENES